MKDQLKDILVALLLAIGVEVQIMEKGDAEIGCLTEHQLLQYISHVSYCANSVTPFTYVSVIHAHVRLEGDTLRESVDAANKFAYGV